MPFIDLKTTAKIDKNQQSKLTADFGKIITIIPGKTERWLMLNFSEECRMAFSGNADSDTAYINVELLGSTTDAVYDKLTEAITDAVSNALSISPERIYVKYAECDHWGWAGKNF